MTRTRGEGYPSGVEPIGSGAVTSHRYDAVGIGNAIVDVIAQQDEEFLIANR